MAGWRRMRSGAYPPGITTASKLLHVHFRDGLIHGHGVTVLAVVFLGVAGAHHHHFGPFFLEPQQGIPQFQVFIEIFGKNGDAFALQTFFQRHGTTSLNIINWKKDKDSRQPAQGREAGPVDFGRSVRPGSQYKERERDCQYRGNN